MDSDEKELPYDKMVRVCHELAIEKFRDSAVSISVDREGSGFVTRVWDKKGALAMKGPEGAANKMEAFRKLKKVLA